MLGAAIAPVAEASASVASVASSDAASVASVLASVVASVVASSFPPHATSDNPIAIANAMLCSKITLSSISGMPCHAFS